MRAPAASTPDYSLGMLDDADLKIDVFRSWDHASGTGGRAVRVTHIPSGIVAVGQGGDSELVDKASAVAEIERQLAQRGL